jgi:hypothetical protein
VGVTAEEGFLAASSSNAAARIRKDYAPWFEAATSFNRLGMKVLPELQACTDNAQQLFAATLFGRALTSFQSIVILAERGLMADARTVARAATETALVLAALASNAAVLDIIELRHYYFRRKLHSVWLHDRASRATMTAEQIAALEKEIATIDRDYPTVKDLRSDPVNVASLADQAGLTSIYNAVYRVTSTDAAHTSISALERHVRADARGQIQSLTVGPEVGDLPDTISVGITMLSLAVEAATGLFGVKHFADELRNCNARWQALGLPHEFRPA